MINTLKLTKKKLNRATPLIWLSLIAYFIIFFMFSLNGDAGFDSVGHGIEFAYRLDGKVIGVFDYGFTVLIAIFMAGMALLKNESRYYLSLGCSVGQNAKANILSAAFIALLIFLSAVAVVLLDRVRIYIKFEGIWTSGIVMTGAEIGTMLGEALVTALLFYVTYMQFLILNICFSKNKFVFIAVLALFAVIFALCYPDVLVKYGTDDLKGKAIYEYFFSYKGISILLSVATVIFAPVYYMVATKGRINR